MLNLFAIFLRTAVFLTLALYPIALFFNLARPDRRVTSLCFLLGIVFWAYYLGAASIPGKFSFSAFLFGTLLFFTGLIGWNKGRKK